MKNPLHAANNFHRARDNSAAAIKVHLRKRTLRALAALGVNRPAVLDCYHGDGVMARACYGGLDVMGIDKKTGTDNIKYSRESDLSRFNFFDLDAYGSPLVLLGIIATKCPLPSGFVLTDGSRLHVQMMHRLPAHVQPYVIGGASRSDGWYYAYPGIVKMCIGKIFASRADVVGYTQMTGRRKHTLYIGFVAVKK